MLVLALVLEGCGGQRGCGRQRKEKKKLPHRGRTDGIEARDPGVGGAARVGGQLPGASASASAGVARVRRAQASDDIVHCNQQSALPSTQHGNQAGGRPTRHSPKLTTTPTPRLPIHPSIHAPGRHCAALRCTARRCSAAHPLPRQHYSHPPPALRPPCCPRALSSRSRSLDTPPLHCTPITPTHHRHAPSAAPLLLCYPYRRRQTRCSSVARRPPHSLPRPSPPLRPSRPRHIPGHACKYHAHLAVAANPPPPCPVRPSCHHSALETCTPPTLPPAGNRFALLAVEPRYTCPDRLPSCTALRRFYVRQAATPFLARLGLLLFSFACAMRSLLCP